MKNMKLSAKLIGSFLVVAVITLVVGSVGIIKIKTISNADITMYTENVLTMQTLTDFDVAFQRMRAMAITISMDKFTGRDRNLGEKIALIKEMDKNGLALVAKYERQIAKRDRKLFDVFKPELVKYLSARDKVIDHSLKGEKETGLLFMDAEATPQGNKVTAMIDKMYEAEIAHARSRSEQNATTANYAILFSCIIVGIGTLLAIAFGMFLSQSIVKPINRVMRGMS